MRVIEEEDTHGLFAVSTGDLLAKHPNGFSCHCLAERLMSGNRPAEQADYIVACGGLVTDAGRLAVSKALEVS